MNVTLTPTHNGPYLVKGCITLLDAQGNQYEVSETIALCRCGHSKHQAVLRRHARDNELRGREQGCSKYLIARA